ncbi:hypothetical protein EPN90_02445 [Patescibacteria group bacterium]|nr:MAG: hypothetical protein EPN90_02445 [Patescibacteria group bacterium]
MRKKFFLLTTIAAFLPVLVLAAAPTQQTLPVGPQSTPGLINQFLTQTGEQGAGYSPAAKTSPLAIVFAAIRTFLALLGIVFTVLLLYGGYMWMMAKGNEQMVEKAKETITRAVIGLIIIVSSLAITQYVFYGLAAGKAPLPGAVPTNVDVINYNANATKSWSPW